MTKKNNKVLFLIILFFASIPLKDFGINPFLIELVYIFVIIAYSVLNKVRIKINRINIILLFISIILLFQFLLPNSSKSRTMLLLVCNMFFAFIFSTLYENSYEGIKISFKVSNYFALLYSFLMIIFTLNNRIYFDTVYKFLSNDMKAAVIALLNSGYGIIFGGATVYIPYLVMLNFLIIISKIITKLPLNKIDVVLIAVMCLSHLLVGRKSELFSLLFTTLIILLMTNSKNFLKVIKRGLYLITIFSILALFVQFLSKLGYLTRISSFFVDLANIDINNTNQINSLSSNRIELWIKAVSLFKSNPLFGIGLGMFSSSEEINVGINVHNTYIQLLCESGIVGFALIVFPLFFIYAKTFRMFKKIKKYNGNKKNMYQTIIISFGIQTYFAIVNFIDPSFYKTISCILYGISIYLLEFSQQEYKKRIIDMYDK